MAEKINTPEERKQKLTLPEWKDRLAQFELQGKEIDIYGVLHTDYIGGQYEKEFERIISGASVVLLEAAPSATGMFSDTSAREYAAFLRKTRPDTINIPDAELISRIKKHIAENDDARFFARLESIAAKVNVPVAVSDVYSGGMYLQMLQMESLDDRVKGLKPYIAGGAFVAMLLEAFYEDLKKNSVAKESVTRRTFLQGVAGTIAAGASLSYGADTFERESESLIDDLYRLVPRRVGRTENPLGFARYNLTDARDVIDGEATKRLAKKYMTTPGPVVEILGNAHTKSIQHYAQHQNERSARNLMYEPYWRIARPKLTIYQSRGGRWEELSRESL